jgi:hypothetical protein
MAASSYSLPIESRREGDQAEELGVGAELDRLEQVGEQEQQGHGQDDLGEHERQQHLEVEAGGQPAPPAVQADGEGDPEGHRDQRGEHGQAQAVQQGPLEVGVVPDRQHRVLPVPAQREALPAGTGAAGVEGEPDGDRHRQHRPGQVPPDQGL